jgi:hypothetical protein
MVAPNTAVTFATPTTFPATFPATLPAAGVTSAGRAIYLAAGLENEVGFDAFEQAFAGYLTAAGRRREVLTIIDFTKPSTDKRLWVIDMARQQVLFHTHVAHGQGSGGNYATHFSNRTGSHQSSLGLYLTGTAYTGGNGYSLLLDGLEPGVNDNARARAVVVHGAAYANPSVIASTGRLGRSWGCPALPVDQTRPIIDAIKDGSILYIYGKES